MAASVLVENSVILIHSGLSRIISPVDLTATILVLYKSFNFFSTDAKRKFTISHVPIVFSAIFIF
jgi:hypothetical protein